MLLLAVETTAATGSLAVAEIFPNDRRAKLLSVRRWQKKATHSEVITLECLQALREANVELSGITHLACDVGPGSFTGIRVGVNLIRTLAFTLRLPTRVFQSLELLAYENLKPDDGAVIAIPAVQGFFYGGSYIRTGNGVKTLAAATSFTREELERLRAQTKVESVLVPAGEPKVETVVQLTAQTFSESEFLSWESVQPLYIRRSEAEEKLRKGLLKPVL